MLNEWVIVRTYSAGVHFGLLRSMNGKEVTLETARRIWSWKGAMTLNEIAVAGVGTGSKISVMAPLVLLTEAIEVLKCTPTSISNLKGATWS